MDNSDKEGILMPGIDDKVFTDEFVALSYNRQEDRLMGIDLLMHFDGHEKSYVLSVESLPLYFSRSDPEQDESDTDQKVYLINAGELLPSVLIDIRQRSFEELEEFLTEQE